MPKRINPVAPSTIANARPKSAAYKLRDGLGLYVLVESTGGKLWRFDYRRPITGKRNTLSLGGFPEVSLKQARERRDECRTMLAEGIDPAEQRKAAAEAGAETFEAVAREWIAKQQWAPATHDKCVWMFERMVFPWLGRRPIASITSPELLATLRRIESAGKLHTAQRVQQRCGQVFRFAVQTGRAASDPAEALRGALTTPKTTHRASLTEPAEVAPLLRAIDGYEGSFPVGCALKLAPMLFVRPGELRTARWADFDLDAAEWRYHVSKTGIDHIVPLAEQAVAILRELQPLTGAGPYLFPSIRSRKDPMSENTINAALRRMGFEKDAMTAHGFRAMARTILDEVLHFRPELIEHQLAHAVRDPLGRAYNRTTHLPERRKMMQAWADYLDTLKAGSGKVVPIRAA